MLEVVVFIVVFYAVAFSLNNASESAYWMWADWRSKRKADEKKDH
jgi:hypothetical protein|tara:strand:- start:121 stop:255 length:135 start_codon:yes stop_codon:yes gene_type:complete